jgi:hypothetical protein
MDLVNIAKNRIKWKEKKKGQWIDMHHPVLTGMDG